MPSANVEAKIKALDEAVAEFNGSKNDGLSQDEVRAYVGAISSAAMELEEVWLEELDAEAASG